MGAANGGDPVLVQPGQDQASAVAAAAAGVPPCRSPPSREWEPPKPERRFASPTVLPPGQMPQACLKANALHGARATASARELPQGQCDDCGEGKIQGKIYPQGDQPWSNGGQDQPQDRQARGMELSSQPSSASNSRPFQRAKAQFA